MWEAGQALPKSLPDHSHCGSKFPSGVFLLGPLRGSRIAVIVAKCVAKHFCCINITATQRSVGVDFMRLYTTFTIVALV